MITASQTYLLTTHCDDFNAGMEPTPLAPALLVALERNFDAHEDQLALDRVQRIPFATLLDWESRSASFRAGLERTGWWETLFARTHPVMYERLKKSAGRRANASALLAMIRVVPR